MVDNVLSRIRAERVVDGDGEETLGHARQIGDLPFGPVLTPQSNAVLWRGNASLFVQMYQASAKVCSPLCDCLVVFPDVGTKGLGNGIVGAVSQAVILGPFRDRVLKRFVWCPDLGDQVVEQRLVGKPPMSVDGAPSLCLRAWQRHTVWLSFWRRPMELTRAIDLGIYRSEHVRKPLLVWRFDLVGRIRVVGLSVSVEDSFE
jgi:hypothetical protein